MCDNNERVGFGQTLTFDPPQHWDEIIKEIRKIRKKICDLDSSDINNICDVINNHSDAVNNIAEALRQISESILKFRCA